MPDDNVISFVKPGKAEGNEVVIKALELMLASAKEGQLNGIAIACIGADGGTSSNYDGGGNKAMLIGAVARLHHRMLIDDEQPE